MIRFTVFLMSNFQKKKSGFSCIQRRHRKLAVPFLFKRLMFDNWLRFNKGFIDDTLTTRVPASSVNTLSILKENLIRKKAIHSLEGIQMKGARSKNGWGLLLMLLAGIVLGGFIGMLAQDIPGLGWLSYGQTFGLQQPVILDLGILVLTLGLSVNISIASIVGMILSIIIYRFL